MVWNMFEQALAKTHEWNGLWKSNCNRYPVLQKKCDLLYEEGLGMIESCFKLGLMYGKGLQTLFWLVFTGMRDWSCFAILLVFEVSKLKF